MKSVLNLEYFTPRKFGEDIYSVHCKNEKRSRKFCQFVKGKQALAGLELKITKLQKKRK